MVNGPAMFAAFHERGLQLAGAGAKWEINGQPWCR